MRFAFFTMLFILLGGCVHNQHGDRSAMAKQQIETLRSLADKYPEQAGLATAGIIAAGSDSPVIYNQVSTTKGLDFPIHRAPESDSGQCSENYEEPFWPIKSAE